MNPKDALNTLRTALTTKGGSIEEALPFLLPFKAVCPSFELIVIGKCTNPIAHDVAICIRGIAEELLKSDGLERTLFNLKESTNLKLTPIVTRGKYEGKEYSVIYLDFPKGEKEQK